MSAKKACGRAWLVLAVIIGLVLAPSLAAAQGVVPTAPQQSANGCWKPADREATGASQQWRRPPSMVLDPGKRYEATIETSDGAFVVELDAGAAPATVNNFVCLARSRFYDDTTFHRIVAGFVIQGGDPTGTGRGGPGYQFQDEKVTKDYTKGTLAMANAGPNTNGSQFFVCLQNVKLPKNYTIFGQVTSGMDVVDTIGQSPTKVGPTGEKSVPIEPVTIESITITTSDAGVG